MDHDRTNSVPRHKRCASPVLMELTETNVAKRLNLQRRLTWGKEKGQGNVLLLYVTVHTICAPLATQSCTFKRHCATGGGFRTWLITLHTRKFHFGSSGALEGQQLSDSTDIQPSEH